MNKKQFKEKYRKLRKNLKQHSNSEYQKYLLLNKRDKQLRPEEYAWVYNWHPVMDTIYSWFSRQVTSKSSKSKETGCGWLKWQKEYNSTCFNAKRDKKYSNFQESKV